MEGTAVTGRLVSGLSVVYLYVKDVEQAAAFYRDVLGIPLQGDDDWVEATFPEGIRFALHRWHEGAPEISAGSVNVNFAVADIDDAAGRLRAAGVEVGEIHRETYGSFFTFVAPEGYRLELFQPPAG